MSPLARRLRGNRSGMTQVGGSNPKMQNKRATLAGDSSILARIEGFEPPTFWSVAMDFSFYGF